MNVSPEYIAGMLDSDGSLIISKRVRKNNQPTYSARFSIHWKKHSHAFEIFKTLQQKYGGYFGSVKTLTGSYYVYSLSDKNIDKFINEVGPFVLLKSKQVEVIMNLRSMMKYRGGKKKTEEEVNTQENLMLTIQQLNKGEPQ